MALAAFLCIAGCAHQAGKQAASGAVTELEKPSQTQTDSKGADVSEDLGRGVARGILEGISEPEPRAQLGGAAAEIARRALLGAAGRATPDSRAQGVGGSGAPGSRTAGSSPVAIFGDQFAAAFAAGFSRELMQQLGDGDGPLSRSLAASSERIAAAAAGAIRDELGPPFPDCQGPDRPACVNKKIRELSGAASSGALSANSTAVLLIVIAFLTGALLAAVVFALLSRRGLVGRAETRS